MILSGTFNAKGDVNGDGEVNIADINVVIDIILGGGVPTPEDHEWVDLGMPSGTLWATRNIGAANPEDTGDFFAWGETTTKPYYNQSNYKWFIYDTTDSCYYCTKYNIYSDWGTVDNKTELEPEDDAAYVNWGPSWRMPNWDQLLELKSECIWQWTVQNGVVGYLLISKVNGNTMFLPATGFRKGDLLYNTGYSGRFWVRSLYGGKNIDLSFSESGLCFCSSPFRSRYYGFCVRPVRISQN